jgi:hypothetical protein
MSYPIKMCKVVPLESAYWRPEDLVPLFLRPDPAWGVGFFVVGDQAPCWPGPPVGNKGYRLFGIKIRKEGGDEQGALRH